jgi:hypothetical protein
MADPASSSSAGQQTIINIKSPLERKQDVFDTEDFDANKFINQIYPDGEWLLPISSTVLSGWHVRALSRHEQLLQLLVLLPLQRRPWGTWIGLLLC